MNLIRATRPRVAARVYAGMWIVDCPRCKGALRLDGSEPLFDCFDCGLRCEVAWPSSELMYGVARLLSMRPVSYTRNWWPGETLADLLEENIHHGIVEPFTGGGVMSIIGDRIAVDTLPTAPTRVAIGAH